MKLQHTVNRQSRSGGFTLIEIIMSLMILTGGIIAVNTSWSGNLLRVRKSSMYNNAAALLERKVTEIDAKYAGRPISEIAAEDGGDFGSEFPQFSWKFKSQKFVMPDLTPIIMGQTNEGVDQMLLTVMTQMQEFMSKSIIEGKVTLVVKSEKSPLEFSVVMYFVDYNQQLSVPGGTQ